MSLEAFTTKVEDGYARSPRRMTEWLDNNYKNEVSKASFVITLKNWIMFIYGKDSVGNYLGTKYGENPTIVKRNVEKRINEIEAGIERYLSDLDKRDFLNDYKGFIQWMQNEGYANLTIRMRCSKAKIFFGRQKDPRCKIDDEDWSQIRRTLLPKSTRASTQDDILTKEQLKRVLQHSSVNGRALALFLLSTGARIGESCKLKMQDIDLDSDPPQVNIREKYTKSQVGGRVMWFSEEARDAIIEWHKVRIGRKKRGSGAGLFVTGDKAGPEDLVFNCSVKIFTRHWNESLARAGKGEDPPVLAKRDPSTKIRIHVYHVHTLRKFFRTNMGHKGSYEGKAGVPDMIVHAWMGHKAYLSEYDRLGNKGMADIYAENMNVVTVHEVGLDEKSRKKYVKMSEDIDQLEAQISDDTGFLDVLGGRLNIPEIRSAVSSDEKKSMIFRAIQKREMEIANMKIELLRAEEASLAALKEATKLIQ